MVIKLILCIIAGLFFLLGCGKDLSQIFFHSSVSQRFNDSTSGTLAVPSPFALPSPNAFNFAVFGDSHVNSRNESLLSRFKQDVTSKNLSFFVVLGDITEDGSTSELIQAKADLDAVGIPYFTTVGNHDLFQSGSNGGWDVWKTTFGAATYSVTFANVVRFLLIDTSSGQIGAEQFDWLRSQLSSQIQYTFVGSHYSIYDGTMPSMWRLESVEERYELIDILNAGNVYAYVGAHTHGFRQSQLGSVLHFVTGSMYHDTLDYGSHGYLLFSYSGGQMSWQQVKF